MLDRGNDIIEIVVLDQFGNDITEECNITWAGDLEVVDPYRVHHGKGSIEVYMTFNGSTMIGYYDPPRDATTDRDGGSSPWIWIVAIMVFILFSGCGLAVSFFIRSRRGNEENVLSEASANSPDGPDMENGMLR